MTASNIVVFGAAGHTGRFVAAELHRRGWTPVLAGRNAAKLEPVSRAHPESEVRIAAIDDVASLDRAFSGADAVINCAGPFLDTAIPVVEAALRARIHYLDVTAEQNCALATFERFGGAARKAGIAIVPAMGFYGGLGDLLATAAMGSWTTAESIGIAVALDSWHPTPGTRLTGQRNTAPRLVVSKGQLRPMGDPPPARAWNFPAPFGTQEVVGLPLSEIVTISRHLSSPEVQAYMNHAPLRDIRDPDTPAPAAADASGRSSQRFVMEAVVAKGNQERRATAQGRDIYAVTAPLVGEAVERILDGRADATGVCTAGAMFDAQDFLQALVPEHMTIEIRPARTNSRAPVLF